MFVFWVLFFCGLTLFHLPQANAALDLTIIPLDGGTDIRFNRGDVATDVVRQLRIRVSSSANVQYQVFQQLVSPLTSETGQVINRPALLATINSSSTGAGTAYLSSFEPVSRSQQLIYTSTPDGRSESFTIAYKVDAQNLVDPGSFTGLVQYVVRQVSGPERQTSQLNVFIESTAELSFAAETSTGGRLIRIDSRPLGPEPYVTLSFNGNSGRNLRVYQEVLSYPVNDLYSELNSGILKMVATGAQQGDLSFQDATDLPRGRVLVYKSTQQSDSFSILYRLSPESLAELSAGHYRGVIRFSFETDHSREDFDFDLDLKISPVFEIVTDFPNGPVAFSGLLPGTDPQIKEVRVKVNTNLGKPYTVIQKMGQMLANEKGQQIDKKYFMIRQEMLNESPGRPAATDFVTCETGDTIIFYSDAKGSAAEFTVFYQLSPYPQMHAGDYRTAIVYSLGEL